MIKELIELQREVDQLIQEKISLSFENTLDKRKIAFKVELSEFANEVGFFKYWKKSHKQNHERIKDEWADCLAFLLSGIITKGFEKEIYKNERFIYRKLLRKANRELLFNRLMFNKLYNFVDWNDALWGLYHFGTDLGYSVDELNDAYRIKTKENIRRAKEGY